MRRTLIAAATAAVALFAPAVPAHAAPTIVGTSCGLVGVRTSLDSPTFYETVVVGAALAADTQLAANLANVKITCTVSSSLGTSTVPSIPGGPVAVAVGLVAVDAPEGDLTQLCTDITATSASGTTTYHNCVFAQETQVLPQEICDLVPVCGPIPRTDFIVVVPQPVVK